MDFLFYHLQMKLVVKVTRNIIFQLWKYHNVLIDGRNSLDKTIKNDLRIYHKFSKIVTGQGYDYTTACLIDYPSFKECYELVAIDISKQLKLDADSKVLQKINFIGSLNNAEGAIMFFIIEELKETVLDFSKGTDKVL